ncbi:MAG TPA: DUF2950 family protein [Candidatus Angelobacter sp.]|nr:DUF2950 family protein [Candidatus Angelobacter sp.]
MSVLVGHNNSTHGSSRRLFFITFLAMGVAASLASCAKRETKAAETPAESATGNVAQKTFASPAAAGAALFAAAQNGDQNALMAIFGPEGKDLIYTGDAVKDKNIAQRFVKAYSEMNRWSTTKSGDELLYIGADNFPFPIPLSKNSSGQWAFNTPAGKQEILARRIGDGELTAIGVLSEIANAQMEYFSRNHQFAQKIVSDEGQQNGLYWPVAEGQPASPLGPLADVAKALGYSRSDKPQPFNGYYYKMLTEQGDAAKGGAKDYILNGKQTGGFAVVAWPAKYGDSGIMTFIVGKDGVVYQKDLGEKTAEAATAITAYNPGEGWSVVLAPESPNAPTGPRTAKK